MQPKSSSRSASNPSAHSSPQTAAQTAAQSADPSSPRPTLGRLEKIDLATYWPEGEADFTPWLAQPDNLKLLGDALGLELEIVAEEHRLGTVEVDLLCRDTVTDQWVLVENQLAPTDAGRLGQILTAAAGLDVSTIVWVASHFAPEHRAVLDWLNQNTQAEINCFGLEIELWRIGDSAMAAKFTPISCPNGWTRTVSKATEEHLTATQRQNLEFWSGLCQHLDQRGSIVKPGTPETKDAMGFAIGRAGFRLYASLDRDDQRLYSELHLSGVDAQPHFYLLAEERDAIAAEIGADLTWEDPGDNQDCSIYATLVHVDVENTERWPEYYQWLCHCLERFHDCFAERVKYLDAAHYQPLPDYSFNPLADSLILPG